MLAGTGTYPCDRVEERDPRSDGSITTIYEELDYGARLEERTFRRSARTLSTRQADELTALC